MPARLHFSNSLEALADRLRENLDRESDPFATTAIAAPASAARDWLKIRLAEGAGVAAGLSFPPLETLLWERLAERDRHRHATDRLPARLLDGFGFQGLVLEQLRREPPEEIRAYLESGEAEDSARRLCQLAGRLASLFREYEYNRVAEHGYAGVAESWMRGEPCFERRLPRGGAAHDEARALERWQMGLYHAIFRKDDGLRDRWGQASGTYRYTLPQYAELALADPVVPLAREEAGGKAPVFHLFGLSNVSPFHRDLIGKLADPAKTAGAPVRFEIYALNPCAEFWEDALTLKERRARGLRALEPAAVPRERVAGTRLTPEEIRDAEAREPDGENGLLALFGKPGRETIRLWCGLTDYDFHEDFREPDRASLLAAVRSSVLRREGPLEARVPRDASLRFLRARDPRAGIEAARAEIARKLRDDATLRPEDCAIIPADPEAALPAIRAAFAGRSDAPGNVPVLVPEGAGDESPLLRGFRALLALGSGEPDRRDLLGFLDNPAAWPATGLGSSPAERIEAVAAFLEAAGFQEKWGDADGDGTGRDGSTLRDAAERALLALALDAGDESLEPRESAQAAEFLPRPANEAAARLEREEISALLDALAALRLKTRPLRESAKRSFAEWADILRALRDAFLEPGPGDGTSELALRRFLDDLGQWGRREEDATNAAENAARVDATLIRMVFEDRFRDAGMEDKAGGRVSFLGGGVRVGGLSALRGLPFRHVWITGLSSAFPASGEAAPLDLRGFRRLPGETDAAARDLYALLEALAATTESLTLSWPARGDDGKERQPSRALTGLMAWLESDVLPPGATLAFDDASPPPEAAPAPAGARTTLWAAEPGPAAAAATVKWRDVAEFLRNPARLAAQRLGGLDWGVLDAEEEARAAALFIEDRDMKNIMDAALRAELLGEGSGAAAVDRLWRARERAGCAPPPPFRDLARTSLREELATAVAKQAGALRAGAAESGLRFAGTLRLGPQGAERAEPPVLNLPTLDAGPLGIALRVGGILPWFFLRPPTPESPGGWALLVEEGGEFPAYLLRLFAAATALPPVHARALGGDARLFVRARARTRGNGGIREHLLPAFAPAEARAILRDLLEDFAGAASGPGRLDDLPLRKIEAILRRADGNPDAVGDWAEAIAEARRAEDEAAFAHVGAGERLLRAMAPEVPARAAEAIRRRALPYLKWLDALPEKNAGAEEDA